MRRFVLTGAPGAGKTAILRQLEFDGFSVVEEAATDVIAAAQARGIDEPWLHPAFVDDVANLQKIRLGRTSLLPDLLQFRDRWVVCTAALAAFLGHPLSAGVTSEIHRIRDEKVFQTQVFFIRGLGFVTSGNARRISLEEAARFEKLHEKAYRDFGFSLVPIEPGSVADRVRAMVAAVRGATEDSR